MDDTSRLQASDGRLLTFLRGHYGERPNQTPYISAFALRASDPVFSGLLVVFAHGKVDRELRFAAPALVIVFGHVYPRFLCARLSFGPCPRKREGHRNNGPGLREDLALQTL